MTRAFQPMLGAKLKEDQDLTDLPYPLYASPKIDGIRGVVDRGITLSRTLKEIPNRYTQTLFQHMPTGTDGELAVGELNHPNLMQRTMSGVMAHEGAPTVTFNVFDSWAHPQLPYWRRLELIQTWYNGLFPADRVHVSIVPQTLIHTPEELQEYENNQLRRGFEGAIVRTPTSKYKFGRSTLREGYLIKLKRYEDAEARVTGFEELLHNANEAERDERGYAKRSSHQGNLIPAGTLGTLICEDIRTGQVVRLGTGFTAAERAAIWRRPEDYLGLFVTYKHFKVTGVKEGRRQPVFKCFRDLRDIK